MGDPNELPDLRVRTHRRRRTQLHPRRRAPARDAADPLGPYRRRRARDGLSPLRAHDAPYPDARGRGLSRPRREDRGRSPRPSPRHGGRPRRPARDPAHRHRLHARPRPLAARPRAPVRRLPQRARGPRRGHQRRDHGQPRSRSGRRGDLCLHGHTPHPDRCRGLLRGTHRAAGEQSPSRQPRNKRSTGSGPVVARRPVAFARPPHGLGKRRRHHGRLRPLAFWREGH